MHDTRPAPAAARPPAPATGIDRRIRDRAWALVAGSAAGAAGALRRAPRRLGAGGLAALRKLADADPARLLRLVRRARGIGRRPAFLAAAEALLTARAEGWVAATPLFERLDPPGQARTAAGLLRDRADPPLTLALPCPDRPVSLPPEQAARTVIYTAVFGDDPPPAPVFYDLPGLRRLCLTDRGDLAVPGWETVVLAPPAGADAGAWCRILPHDALAAAAPGATASLYLAPDRWLVGNVHTLLARWCHAQDLVLWRNAGAADWHDLVEQHLMTGGSRRDAVLAQARDCAARGLARKGDAADCGVIWRQHARPEVRALMQRWWDERQRHPGGLESVALTAALDGAFDGGAFDGTPDGGAAPNALRPRLLPAALGPTADNAFTARLAPRGPARRAAAPALRRGRLPVAFVYAESQASSASTFLRGRQLSELVADHCPDRFEVSYTSDLEALRDRIVILTSGAMKTHSAATIRALRRRCALVIGSWDHVQPDPEKVRETDANMTLSHRQTLDLARLYPAQPACMVTHHVNRQIAAMTSPVDRPRIGYFGLPVNTHRLGSLERLVDVIGINTLEVGMDWTAALPHYNAHWIVRRSKPNDGWKPFLKGFVAARCGAVVIVGRDDEDAVQYLGDDYPFYVRSPDPALLEYDTAAIVGGFGGADWRKAQGIMAQVAARSGDAQVAAEFRAMIADLTC